MTPGSLCAALLTVGLVVAATVAVLLAATLSIR